MVHGDYESDYETMLQKAKMQTLHVGRIKTLVTEIYLTLIPWLPCYITFISRKNDVIIIVKLLYRATSRRRVAL